MTSIGSGLSAQPKSFCQFKFADRKQLYDVLHNGLKLILKEQFDIKFIYSEKATKFCEISNLLLTCTT